MARKIDELTRELLELGLRERATLANILLESLEGLSQEDLDRLWADEAEARYGDLLDGTTTAIDGDEVFARARSRKW